MKQAIELILSVAFACAIGLQVHAQTSGPSPIVVEHPWARATPGGAKTGNLSDPDQQR
jgi:copper(I)-binding protein